MAAFALQQIETAVRLFTSLCQYHPKVRRYRRNLDWLEKLRIRASARLAAATTANKDAASGRHQKHHSTGQNGDAADEFLGWRTRLIERTGQDRPTVSTILSPVTPTGSLNTSNTNPSPNATYAAGAHDHVISAEMMAANTMQPWPSTDPMNAALHDFWDPIQFSDLLGTSDAEANPFMANGSAWWEPSAGGVDLGHGP
jgi:hypothetical protein